MGIVPLSKATSFELGTWYETLEVRPACETTKWEVNRVIDPCLVKLKLKQMFLLS